MLCAMSCDQFGEINIRFAFRACTMLNSHRYSRTHSRPISCSSSAFIYEKVVRRRSEKLLCARFCISVKRVFAGCQHVSADL